MRKVILVFGLIASLIVAAPVLAAVRGGMFGYDVTYEYHRDFIAVHITIDELTTQSHIMDIDLNVLKENPREELKR